MKSKVILILILSLKFVSVFAQKEITENMDFERIIENLLPAQELDMDYNDVYDRLISLYSKPLDLNSADRSVLQSLFILSEEQISGILEYRKMYGKFLSAYELLSVEGFDKETVEQILPFVSIVANAKESFRSSIGNPDNNELFLRYQTTLEQKKGYTPPDTSSTGKITSRYAGNPGRIYGRYLFAKESQYSLGFTFEKDPGEQIVWDKKSSRYGLDYYSFHLMVENKWIFKKIIIGDFSMDFGQSLVFGSGVRMGKGYEPITTIRRNNMGLKPYRSVYENKDFSGIAISSGSKSLEFNVFYSLVKRDAILRADSEIDSDQYISYIQTIGLHRTLSEINAKHKLSDQSFGGNINFKTNNRKLEIGLNGICTKFSLPVQPTIKKYNQFEFKGLRNALGGVYFNYHLKNAHIFSEMAISESKGKAIAAGIVASLSSQVQISLHLRSYDKNYHSFYAEGFGENTKNANEQGVYWGIKLNPVSGLILAAYYDFYQFPWLKYQVDKPSSGKDFMFSTTYELSKQLSFRAQYRYKSKEINNTKEGFQVAQIVPKSTDRLLLDMNYWINANYSIKTRIQYSRVDFNHTRTSGFILSQDLNYTNKRITFSTRFALFDTDNYDNRQFIYERDLLYVYSVPFFYNRGARFYFLAKYQIAKKVTFWFKYSKTKYLNLDTIGSELEEIDGDNVSNISLQTRLRF